MSTEFGKEEVSSDLGGSTSHAMIDRKPDTSVLIFLPRTLVVVKEAEKKQMDICIIPSQTGLTAHRSNQKMTRVCLDF